MTHKNVVEKVNTDREEISPSKRQRENNEEKIEEVFDADIEAAQIVEHGDIVKRDELGKDESKTSKDNKEARLDLKPLDKDASFDIQQNVYVSENLRDSCDNIYLIYDV